MRGKGVSISGMIGGWVVGVGGFAIVAFTEGEDAFGVRICPEMFVVVEGPAVIVFEHPEALDEGPECRRGRIFVVEHRLFSVNEFKHYIVDNLR
jgi:hypothetical protein